MYYATRCALLALATSALGGCYQPNSYASAYPTGKGNAELTVAVEGTLNEVRQRSAPQTENVSPTATSPTEISGTVVQAQQRTIWLPAWASFHGRYGISDAVEIGGHLGFSNYGLDLKLNLVDDKYVALAIDPTVATTITSSVYKLPVLMALRPIPELEFNVALAGGYAVGPLAGTSKSVSATGALLEASLGLRVHVHPNAALMPQVTFWRVAGDSAQGLSYGLGVVISGERKAKK